MKITIKALIFFAIISISFSLKIERVEKSKRKKNAVKSKTKADDGEGSWDQGFRVPGFLVVSGNEGFNEEEKNRKGKGRFYPAKLETPTTAEERLGWVYDMTTMAPTGSLAKIMVRIQQSNLYYIPFRWINSDVTYTNPSGYKYFEFWVMNDARESFHVRVLLPWKATGWIINDDQGKKIATLLSTKKSQSRAIVDSKKTNANTAANSYLTNKPLYDAAMGDAAKLKAERDKQINQLATITADQKAKQKSFDDNQAAINNLESQIKPLKDAQNSLNTDLSSLTNQINQINASLATLDTGAKSADLATGFQTNLKKAEADLRQNLSDLSAETPIRQSDIQSAQDGILTKLSKPDFNSNLNKLFP